MKDIKIEESGDAVSIEHTKQNGNSSISWCNKGLVNALIFHALEERHGIEINRLDNDHQEHFSQLISLYMLSIKKQYELITKELYKE